MKTFNNTKKRKLSPYKRKLILNNEEWSYQITKSKIGSNGYIHICNPERTKKITFKMDCIGKSSGFDEYLWCPEEFDGDDSEIYSISITPKYIRKLILEHQKEFE